MIKKIKKRENKYYEIQWYNEDGDNVEVTQCETIEELAQYLARCMWGSLKGFKYNPSIWYNGNPWCKYEFTPVDCEFK